MAVPYIESRCECKIWTTTLRTCENDENNHFGRQKRPYLPILALNLCNCFLPFLPATKTRSRHSINLIQIEHVAWAADLPWASKF